MRLAWLVLLTLGSVLVHTAAAAAGTYGVVACAAAPDGGNHSWTGSTSDPRYLTVASTCPPTAPYSGLAAYDNLAAPGYAPSGAQATWRFAAPRETTITALRYSDYLGKHADDDWAVFAKTDGGRIFDTCNIALVDLSCSAGQAGFSAGTERTVNGLDTSGLTLGFRCEPTNGASTCSVGVNIHAVWAALYSATVTLSDLSSPSVSNVRGPLLDGGFVSGRRDVFFDASDNAGVRQGRVYVDGAIVASETYPCDFTYTVPCSNRSGSQLGLETRSLSDGSHSVQVAAVDPAGNEQRSPAQEITVDNGAPAPPEELSVDGGDSWRSENSFSVSWKNPAGQVAPVAVAHYEVCTLDEWICGSTQRVAADDLSHIDGISVPSPGLWVIRVWLEDAAGNVDRARVATATLRYGSPPRIPPAQQAPSADVRPPSAPDTAAVPGSTTPAPAFAPRRDPLLRLTSARLTRGRLVVRGVLARGASAPLSISARLQGGRRLRRRVLVRGGRFAISLPAYGTGSARGTITARFGGNLVFRPAVATLRLPR